jgi:hypothetical protein
MPRQPLSKVVPFNKKPDLTFAHFSHQTNPEAMSLVGNCIATWSYVEAEMAIVLGILLGAGNEAAVSVFNILRRSSSQREAISEAAKPVLSADELEVLSAILNITKSLERDRNAFAHGIIGICPKHVPDGVLYLETDTQVFLRLKYHLKSGFEFNEKEYRDLYDHTWVYKTKDLTIIRDDYYWLWEAWYAFLTYYRSRDRALFSQLCAQTRIAEELAILRQKSEYAVPPQLHHSKQGG